MADQDTEKVIAELLADVKKTVTEEDSRSLSDTVVSEKSNESTGETVVSEKSNEGIGETVVSSQKLNNIFDNGYDREHNRRYIKNDIIAKRFAISSYKDWVTYDDIEYRHRDLATSFPFMIWKFFRWIGMYLISPFCADPRWGWFIYFVLIVSIFLVIEYYTSHICQIKQIDQAVNNIHLRPLLVPSINEINRNYKNETLERRNNIKNKVRAVLDDGKTYNFKISNDDNVLLELIK